jgi:hypothetical protein
MKFAVVLVLLGAVAGSLWYLHDRHGAGFLKITLGGGDDEAAAPVIRPPAARPVEPIAVGVAGPQRWMTDERWERGVRDGEAGLALIELAYHEHFEVAGDPFLFRSRKEEAGRLLTSALRDMSELREAFAEDPTALLEIQPLLRKYEEGLAKTPRR